MESNPIANIFFQKSESENLMDVNTTVPGREHSSANIEPLHQGLHQPIYRKRENKVGQKEKRVLKKSASSPCPKTRNSRKTRSSNITVKSDSSKHNIPASKTNHSGEKSKQKSKKHGNGKQKKKSKLAFWFCMSANTDTVDHKSQTPLAKLNFACEQDLQVLDQDVKDDTRTKSLATSHSTNKSHKRLSAPPLSDWAEVVTRAIVESPEKMSMSVIPESGVRYRYDGTLERPYVYPGGLTYQSKRTNTGTRGGENNIRCSNATPSDISCSAECIEQNNENQIRKKLYLRYDSSLKNSSKVKDKRYSVPANFADHSSYRDNSNNNPSQAPNDIRMTATNNNQPMSSKDSKENYFNKNVIYDIPYESDNDNIKTEIQKEDDEIRNSYYSQPLYHNHCIYMWHSCEDLQDCEQKYHSSDAINRICTPSPSNANNSCLADSANEIHYSNHHITNSERVWDKYFIYDDTHNISSSSVPVGPYSSDINDIGHPRKLSFPSGLNCVNIGIKSSDMYYESRSRNITANETNYTSKDNCGNNGHDTNLAESPIHSKRTKDYNNFFKRNNGRSSCMPGNKRFFFPPPPCYKPPKEEMEASYPLISKTSCNRGSQTDLNLEIKEMDMKDWDCCLEREVQPTLSTTKYQLVNFNESADINTNHEKDQYIHENGPYSYSLNDTCEKILDAEISLFEKQTNPNYTHNLGLAQNVITSTPKTTRKSNDPVDETKAYTGQKPVPRKRNKIKQTDSSQFLFPEFDDIQSTKMRDTIDHHEETHASTNLSSTYKIVPVPKKRRSQMIESDFIYSTADIENGLAKCNHGLDEQGYNKVCSHNDRITILSTEQAECGIETSEYVGTQLVCQQSMSPDSRCQLRSMSLDSTIDGCLSRKSTALSPSLDNMVDIFQQMTYDSDNEENCNADDEMSIHNEDIPIFKSSSMENLLRSRSILDRSLAVTRKRRQRLRERKCQSQVIVSSDVNHYVNKSEKNPWKPYLYDNNPSHDSFTPNSFDSRQHQDHYFKQQLFRHKNLWKHSYTCTDSGNDSDMMSLNDVRDRQQAGYDVFHGLYGVSAFCQKRDTRVCDWSRGTLHKKPWEFRLRQKHELRKARSREHLFWWHSLETQETQVNESRLETCV